MHEKSDSPSPNKIADKPSNAPDRRVRSAAAVQGKDRDMGAALRSVWQKTVEESVPGDMLDLLGKLD